MKKEKQKQTKPSKNLKSNIQHLTSNPKGITLIALVVIVVIIILMVILAGAIIQMVLREDTLTKKKNVATKTEENEAIEKEVIEEEHNWTRRGDTLTCSHCNTTLTIGQEVNYTAGGTASTSISGAKSGVSQGISDGELGTNSKIQADGSQTITRNSETTWVVLGIEDSNKNGTNETLLLTTEKPTEDYFCMYGAAAYNNGVEIIEEVCKKLYGTEARAMTIEDVNNCLGYTPAGGMYYGDEGNQTTGNFTTKLNKLPTWKTIKANGTYTPDGANTEEALGEYELNGYHYYLSSDETYLVDPTDSSNTRHTITATTRDLIFGSSESYFYWLASRGVVAYGGNAFFGPGAVGYGYAYSYYGCFYSGGDLYNGDLPVRAVVSLRSEIPETIEQNEVIENGTMEEIHNWTRRGDNLTCSHCNTTLTIGQEVEYTAGGTASTSISGAKSGVSQGISDGWLNTNDKIQADGSQTIAKDAETTWVVLGIEDSNKNGTNETLLLTTATPTEDYFYMYGAAAYNNGVDIVEDVCKKLYGTEARGMTIEDVNNCLGYTPAGGMYNNGSLQTTGNFTTKLNELPTWETIKANGTYTPDGANTEEALGNYELNGYYYYLSSDKTYLVDPADSSNTSHTVTTATRDLIFGSSDDYYWYWLASRGVCAGSDCAGFGPGGVLDGNADSYSDLIDSNGYSNYGDLSVRAVVSLRSDIPATT